MLTVANSQGKVVAAPSAVDGVNVAAAHTAALNFDLNIVVTKRLRVKFPFREYRVGVGGVHLEALELVVLCHVKACCKNELIK